MSTAEAEVAAFVEGFALVRLIIHRAFDIQAPLSLQDGDDEVRADLVLRDLGVEVGIELAPEPLDLDWDTATLYYATKTLDRFRPIPAGTAHIFFVPKLVANYAALPGVMFDERKGEDRPGRQGAIVATSGRTRADVFRTFLHEVGHLLGLDHPSQPDRYIMTPRDRIGGEPIFAYSPRDRQRIQHLRDADQHHLPGKPLLSV